MAKLTNIRERVQQPYRDCLLRTAGYTPGGVSERNTLFNNGGSKDIGTTNLPTGNVLPSDNSMIILALRVFMSFRNPVTRRGVAPLITVNGDIDVDFPNGVGEVAANNAPADTHDVLRLYVQAGEQAFWSFGAGQKQSIVGMPSVYFPFGGAVVGDLGGATDLIHMYNGDAGHPNMLKLARAILLVPRQAILCECNIQKLPDGGQAGAFGSIQVSRNMNSLVDNLNAVDGMNKTVSFCFDGLFSRDVQLVSTRIH